MKKRLAGGQVVVFLCTTFISSHSLAIRMYEAIDLCPGQLNPHTHAHALNDDGVIVGYRNGRPFVFDGDWRDIQLDDSKTGRATDINNAGLIVGLSEQRSGRQCIFVENEADGTISYVDLWSAYSCPDIVRTNSIGQICGSQTVKSHLPEAFVWDPQHGLTVLGSDSAAISRAFSINDCGQVVGDVGANFSYMTERARIWDVAYVGGQGPTLTVRDPFTPAGYFSSAVTINNAGVCAGYVGRSYPTHSTQAAVWNADGTLTLLRTLGGPTAEAMSINEKGEVVGWAETTGMITPTMSETHAFLWDQDRGFVDLQDLIADPGELAFAEKAIDINAAGQIIASGRRQNFHVSTFLLVPHEMPYRLERIEIQGESLVPQNARRSYLVCAYYENNVTVTFSIATEWSVEGDGATISRDGVLNTSPSKTEHVISLAAVYADGADTCTATLDITIIPPRTLAVPEAYPTIQAAIDAAREWDTVLVADGTYRGPGNRDIDFCGKKITVRSAGGPERCIIDCEGSREESHRGFVFQSGEESDSVLDGFTITGGYVFVDNSPILRADGGGGILIKYSSPMVRNCIICGNTFEWTGHSHLGQVSGGGGVDCSGSEARFEDCVIKENTTTHCGGGIAAHGNSVNSGSVVLANCMIGANSSASGGGVFSSDRTTIRNCVVSGNVAECGGGLFVAGEAAVDNTIISGNSAEDGGGIALGDGTQVRNCTIVGNSASAHGGGVYYSASQLGNLMVMKWLDGERAHLVNCILATNKAQMGSQLAHNGPVLVSPIQINGPRKVNYDFGLTVKGCVVEGGREGVWLREWDPPVEIDWDRVLVWDDSNIDGDPGFIEPGHWDEAGTQDDTSDDYWIDGNYRLRPDSICIDAGVPCDVAGDIAGKARPFDFPLVGRTGGPAWDIGAHEAVVGEDVRLHMIPRVINRQSGRGQVLGFITGASALQGNCVWLLPAGIVSQRVYAVQTPPKANKLHLFAFFDAAQLLDAIPTNGQVEVGVAGLTPAGDYFFAREFIRIAGRKSAAPNKPTKTDVRTNTKDSRPTKLKPASGR